MSSGKLPIRIRIDAEDTLLAKLGERLLKEFGDKYALEGVAQIWDGKSNLDKEIPIWNRGARLVLPRLVLRDLDSLAPPDDGKKCPASETVRLLGKRDKSPHLLLRFAVAEAESWLLADGEALGQFLDVKRTPFSFADSVRNPKARLVALARKSRRKDVRKDFPPAPNSGRKVGPAYNTILAEFVSRHWAPERAKEHSKSLRRTLERLEKFADGV